MSVPPSAVSTGAASPSVYPRDPHLRGDLLVFVAGNDVWTAPASGGPACRASTEQEPARYPRLSPDGRTLAWTGMRDGAPEVVAAPVGGGSPARLTHWGDARTRVLGWVSDDEVLAVSTVGERPTRRTRAWAVPLDGGPARALPYGPVAGVAHGPGGAVLVQTPSMFGEAAFWQGYRGGTTGRLWLDRHGDGDFVPVHTGLEGNVECPMWVGGRLAFLSDHTGTVQLWSSTPDGADLRQHTRHPHAARNASSDGTRVVHHSGGRIWLSADLEPGTGPVPVEVRTAGARPGREPYLVSAADELDGFAPDRDARGAVLTVRGSLHLMPGSGEPARQLPLEAGARARLPRVLGSTGRAAHVVVVDGVEALEVVDLSEPDPLAPPPEPRRIGAGRIGRVRELEASPDGRRLALATHDGRVLVADVASGELREVDRSTDGEITDLVLSPDSRWLAWSHPGANRLRQLRLADLTDPQAAVVEGSPLRFSDRSPAFTLDGRHLLFLSERSFETAPQAHVLGLSFLPGTRLYALRLAADTPSLFAGAAGAGPDRTVAADGGEVRVDREGLTERAEPFPVPPGDYIDLQAARGGALWIRKNASADWLAERGTLLRWEFGASAPTELRTGVDAYTVGGDGRRMLVRTESGLVSAPADGPAGPAVDIPLALASVLSRVDPPAEWAQAFAEDGGLIADICARADLGGLDWKAVLDSYRPLLGRLGDQEDFLDLLWELHGRLGASHTYVKKRPRPGAVPPRRQGLLGADLERTAEGDWRVARIPGGDGSVDGGLSPLRAPGADVREGDVVLAVDGTPVDAVRGPGPALSGRAGVPVRLTVRAASGGPARTSVVVPVATDGTLRYHSWVAEQRDRVAEESGGRLGYLHMPDMMGDGWAQLHRDMRTEFAKEGLVLDLRENAGGFLSELVVERLARRVLGWRVSRQGAALSYPSLAPRGPVVVVTDEFTGSDGDVAAVAVRALGIGPIVGVRTWGGVNVMDWNFSLVDGTGLVLPREAYWFEGPGWQVENHGVAPDVEVPRTPHDWAAGHDPQLDTAVRVALKNLDEHPAATPPRLG
ncbi:S41 family peptidase [Streptomyces sp. CA-294286]|uniref:S41 family peptidase n=1 Tax=Streptomyces sp. CA-294286 TaxID=3240070 RepID=UPI003D950644